MKRYLLYAGIAIALAACSSSAIKEVKAGGDWSGHSYMHYCPEYSFSPVGKMYKPLNILDDNHISLAPPDAAMAVDKARDYIVDNAGKGFMMKTTFESIDINVKDSAAAFERKHPKYDLEKCANAKYYVRFLYSPAHETEYCFGIAMDVNYNVLSATDFPLVSRGLPPEKVIGPHEANRIAMKKHRNILTETDEARFAFNDSLNCFVWEIRGKEKPVTPVNTKSTRRDYKFGYVCINAHTGEILYYALNEGFAMVNPRYF